MPGELAASVGGEIAITPREEHDGDPTVAAADDPPPAAAGRSHTCGLARATRGNAAASREEGDRGQAGNARLTAATAAVLLVLLVAELVTLLAFGSLLSAHVFIGMLLIPPIALKLGSTG